MRTTDRTVSSFADLVKKTTEWRRVHNGYERWIAGHRWTVRRPSNKILHGTGFFVYCDSLRYTPTSHLADARSFLHAEEAKAYVESIALPEVTR